MPTTPTRSPPHKKLKITATQKQALIDNLQLEITERARQLRASYALQSADLRSRIERRVQRIPVAMRKMTMGELMVKHGASQHKQIEAPRSEQTIHAQVTMPSSTERPLPPLPAEASKPSSPSRPQIHAPAPRPKKRKTSDIIIASDGDASEAAPTEPIIKKTRARAGAAPTTAPTRTTSRAVSRSQKPTSVLSPRSHNSRTLPRSPIKEWNSPTKSMSPMKSMIARPVGSPLKPASPLKTAASAATSALSAAAHGVARSTAAAAGKLSRQASREKTATTTGTTNTKGKMLPPPRPNTTAPPSPQRIPSSQTVISDSSATTSTSSSTVLKGKRGRPATTKGSPAAKKTLASKAKTALKGNKEGVNKKVVVAEPAAGRRVLRKRN